MKNKTAVTAAALVAGCAMSFRPVEPQPTSFERDNPCNEAEPTQRAQPEYPASAARVAQPGWVALQYDINAEGAVSNITVPSSSPPGVFEDAARKALEQWRYRTEEPLTGCRILFTFRPPES